MPNKVLMIGWEYPPHNSGGLGVACAGLTKALSDLSTDIKFTLPYQHSSDVDHMSVLSCMDESWPEFNQSINRPPFSAYAQVIETKYTEEISNLDSSELRLLPQSELELKVNQYADKVVDVGLRQKNHYDVIHSHDWMAFPAGMKLKQKTGKPLVTHIHSTEFDRSALGSGSQFITHTEYEGMMSSDKIIAVSYYTKRLLIDKYQVDPNKIEVVYNGIEPLVYSHKPQATFAKKRPVVAFMGRLTLQKGVEFFIQVAKKVTQVQPDVLFVVAGSGDMYHELLLKTAQAGVSASVVFSGFVRDAQKDKLLSRANVFLMPSVSEPFGLVALEAAQRGIPVVVSANAGVSEVLPHSIIVDFWDVDKMADSVLKIINDSRFAEQTSRGQKDDLTQISWKKSAQKVQQVYRKAFLGR